MTPRAFRKKARRTFKVWDLVTWGNGQVAHVVKAVLPNGVVVDASSEAPSGRDWSSYFVPFEGGVAGKTPRTGGPRQLRHAKGGTS